MIREREKLKNIIANKVKNVLLHKSGYFIILHIMDTFDQGKKKVKKRKDVLL